MVSRRNLRLTIVGGATAAMLLSPGAGQAAFSLPILLREADVIRLQDVASRAADVAVGWREGASPGALWVRISRDGGRTFGARYPVAGLGRRGMSLAICDGQVWAVSAAQSVGDDAGDADLMLSDRDLDSGVAGQVFLTNPGVDHTVNVPEIACVGDRALAIAWLDRADGVSRARVIIRGLGATASGVISSAFDLGVASPAGGISVTANLTAAMVAWTRGAERNIRYRRFAIAQDGSPSPEPAVTLATGDAVQPRLAARREDVVIAYSDSGRLRVRVSDDGGRTFGPPVTVLGVGSVAAPSRATSATISGERIVIEAMRPALTTAAGPEPAAVDETPMRLESRNAGSTWSKVEQGNRGIRVGVLRVLKSGATRLLEAWHDDGATVDRLRFQRETS